MSRPILLTRMLIALMLGTCAAGCSGTATSPAATVGPSLPAPASAAAATVTPTITPDPPAASLGEPPAATLAAEGGDPVAGSLGSFTWGDGGSDSPWLPGAPISVGAGEPLTVTLPGDVPIGLAAKRVPRGHPDGVGAVALGARRRPPDHLQSPASPARGRSRST